VTDEEWEKQRARAVAAAFQTGRPVFADTDGALRYADGAREEVPPGVGSATSVDAEFSGFFRSIGYVVERNGKIATLPQTNDGGGRWVPAIALLCDACGKQMHGSEYEGWIADA
jgi:hypothetical protein